MVPAYNASDFIGKCIKSIISQSYDNIEIIIIDDGSTDDTPAICDYYAEKDDRVKVVHQPNCGRTAARWEGVKHSTGEWLTFVDADDLLPTNAVKDLVAASREDVDIVLGNGYLLPEEHRTVIPLEEFKHLTVRAEGQIGLPWGSLYRRPLLDYYAFDMSRDILMGEDYIFWLRIVFATNKDVAVCFENIYTKGEDHTCNTFVWTADYAQQINNLRMDAIPFCDHEKFLPDAINDRIAVLLMVAQCQKKSNWKHHTYYLELLQDMHRLGITFTAKQRLFLSLPSLFFRKLYIRLGSFLRSLRK